MPGPFAPRSPEQRTARQAARTAPGLVGGKVPSVGPVQIRRAQDRTQPPAAAAGGGGVTGWANYEFTFPSGLDSVVSGYTFTHASTVTLTDSGGAPPAYAALPDGLLTNPGVFVVDAAWSIQSTDADPSEVHAIEYGGTDTAPAIGRFTHAMNSSQSLAFSSGSGFFSPGFTIKSTAAVSRHFTLHHTTVYLSIARWDLP